MKKARMGTSARKRISNRPLWVEPLEIRRCLAASVGWDGPGLGGAALTYYIGTVPSSVGLSQSAVESAIETALDSWANVADVTFTRTSLARQSDSLDITFTRIDGPGGTLAQAYLPDDVNRGRLAGDVQFDVAEPWEIGNNRGASAFDLVYVAVHEIGHSLGLDHLLAAGSVMRPSVSPTSSFSALAAADVDAILGLYAAASTDSGGGGDSTSNNTDTSTDTADTGGGDASDNNTDNTDDAPAPRNRRVPWWRGRGGGRFGRILPDVLVAEAPYRHNMDQPTDVNGDGAVTPVDALVIINELNAGGSRVLGDGETSGAETAVDVNGDQQISPLDALLVVNQLNTAGQNTATPSSNTNVLTAVEEDAPVDNSSTDEVPGDNAAADDDSVDSADGEDAADDNSTDTSSTDSESEDNSDDQQTDTEDDQDEDERPCPGGLGHGVFGMDANDDGLLTADEVPELIWDRISPADADGDGAVSMDELATYRATRKAEQIVNRFDDNADGSLTEDEVPERLWERLVGLDADSDGVLTTEELAAGPLGVPHFHPGFHSHGNPFEQLDANEDELLTEDEVPARLWDHIASADTNGDNAISQEELADALPLRGHHQHHGGRGFV